MNTEQTVIVTPAEDKFCMYKRGIASSSTEALFNTIFLLDDENQAKMVLAFPELVEVVQRYRYEKGYWKDLVKRWNIIAPGQPIIY